MRWLIITIFTLFMFVLDQGLSALVEVSGVTPSFLLVFAMFLALTAPVDKVPWLMICLGLCFDLSILYPLAGGQQDFVLLGPGALGFLLGGWTAIQMRNVVFRDSPLAIAVTVFVAGLFVHLVIVMLLSLRGLGVLTAEPMSQWIWSDQLVRRFFSLIYSAAVALPLSFLLIRLEPLMGITPKTATTPRRMRQVV